MAKRRLKPAVNPLNSDLINAAIAPVDETATPTSPQPDIQEEAPALEVHKEGPPKQRATAPRPLEAPPQKTRKSPPKLPTKSKPRDQKTLRVRFPDTEFEENEAFTKSLRALMGDSKVTESDITRALWSLVRRAEDSMGELSAKAPRMPRPANGDWMAKAEYDDAVARFLHLAIKKMGVGD